MRAQLDVARRLGAELHFDERVISWKSDGDRVRVETTRDKYTAQQLVVSAGPWTTTLFPELELRQVLVWLEPSAHADWYDPARCPIYLWEYARGHLGYGFPRLASGVKAAVFHDGDVVRDPDAISRAVDPDEIQRVRDAVRHILPGVASGSVRTVFSTSSKNVTVHQYARYTFSHRIHPSFPNVLISSPCSGHGFKFASAIGELQADLLIDGRTRFDVTPFRLARSS